MRASELTQGPAGDVADYLNSTNADQIDVGVLTSALVNALNRIEWLENRVKRLENRLANYATTGLGRIVGPRSPSDGK